MTPTNPSSQDLPNPDVSSPNYLNELLGKYKTPEEVAKAKYFGDQHIQRLEAENAKLREDYTRAREENIAKARLEDLLDQIQNSRTTEPAQPNRLEEKAIDYKQIESLIENKLKQTELTRTYNQNLQTVKDKLIARYGDNYTDAYKQQIERLDLTREEADDLARRKPTTFAHLLGLDQPKQMQQQFTTPPRQQTQTPQNPVQQPPEKRTWAWYENLRKTDKTAYLSPRMQVQMLQDRMEQGEAFNDAGFDVSLGGKQ